MSPPISVMKDDFSVQVLLLHLGERNIIIYTPSLQIKPEWSTLIGRDSPDTVL